MLATVSVNGTGIVNAMGRRPEGITPRTHVIGVRLTDDGYERVVELAEAAGLSVSAMARKLMSEAINARLRGKR